MIIITIINNILMLFCIIKLSLTIDSWNNAPSNRLCKKLYFSQLVNIYMLYLYIDALVDINEHISGLFLLHSAWPFVELNLKRKIKIKFLLIWKNKTIEKDEFCPKQNCFLSSSSHFVRYCHIWISYPRLLSFIYLFWLLHKLPYLNSFQKYEKI